MTSKFIFLAPPCSKEIILFLAAVRINLAYVDFFLISKRKLNSVFQVSKIDACSLEQSETIILPFAFRFGGCGTYIEPENNSEGILLCFGQSWRDQCYWSEDLDSNQWTNIGKSHKL